MPSFAAIGEGGESRRPLGLCVVGGLLFSQRITLYLAPVVCLYFASVQSKISRPKITPAPPG
jgi:HAE1 family hydrophobic/amphiphilic exporter-1